MCIKMDMYVCVCVQSVKKVFLQDRTVEKRNSILSYVRFYLSILICNCYLIIIINIMENIYLFLK